MARISAWPAILALHRSWQWHGSWHNVGGSGGASKAMAKKTAGVGGQAAAMAVAAQLAKAKCGEEVMKVRLAAIAKAEEEKSASAADQWRRRREICVAKAENMKALKRK
jgi:hypothetical protein